MIFHGKTLSLKKKSSILITVLLVLDLLLFLFWLFNFKNPISFSKYPEVQYLASQELNFSDLKPYFTKLAEKKGADYAFNVLKIAPIKPGTDMHLLGHVVGEILYKQQGAAGIKTCTQDFRNACSHTIVVGLFGDKGVAALPEIAKACQEAPGGKGAYTMCFHGLGHGVLAYTGYNLEKTVLLCEKTATAEHNRREFAECVGGAIMEIISGGDHDPELWAIQSQKYLGTSDPLFPCNANYMPSEVRGQCYAYLTPQLFRVAGAALGNPGPSDFKKAFTYCNKLSIDTEKKNRDACYGGFGKEFVVLAKKRDIRNISSMTRQELGIILSLCKLADVEDGRLACLWHSLGNLYWGGENEYQASINFCNLLSAGDKSKCFEQLILMVRFFKSDTNYKNEFCADVPPQYKCKEKI